MRLKKILLLFVLALITALLSSCIESTGDFFSLPISKHEYQNLQSDVGEMLVDGWELATPTTGTLRTTMHFSDLTGDGKEDIIVLLRNTNTSELKFLVYTYKNNSYDHYMTQVLKGSAFARIEFCDLTGDGDSEIVLGIQYGTEALYNAIVYEIVDKDLCEELLNVEFTDLCMYDADGDKIDNLLILQNDESGNDAAAKLFGYENNNIIELGEAPLSAGVTRPEEIVTGYIQKNIPVAVVESKYYVEGYISDALIYYEGEFSNIGYDATLQINSNYLKPIYIAAGDHDNDGFIELPRPVDISRDRNDAIYRIDWYSVSPDKDSEYDYTTHDCPEDDWYIIFPTDWRYIIRIERSTDKNGVSVTSFYRNAGENEKIVMLTVKKYSPDTAEYITDAERTVITRGNEIITVSVPKKSGDTIGITLNEAEDIIYSWEEKNNYKSDAEAIYEENSAS